MLREALRVPLADDRGVRRLCVGGGLLAISFWIAPLVLVLGYLVRFVQTVVEDRDELPPSFEYWGLLMSSGVRAFGITVVYLFVPMAVMVWGVFLYLIAPVNDSVTVAQARPPLTAAAVLFSVAFYLLPAALLTYSIDGRFRAGFSPRLLGRFWFSWAYLRSWLLAVVLVSLLHLAAAVVVLTAIGVLAVPVIAFYSYLAGMYLLTVGTSDLLDDIDPSARLGRRT